MFIVADDLVGAAARAVGQGGAAPADRHEFVLEAQGALRALAFQSFAQCVEDGFGNRLSGPRRKLAGKAIGLGMLDVERHARLQ